MISNMVHLQMIDDHYGPCLPLWTKMCLVIFYGIKGIQRMNSTRREMVESLRNRLLQVGYIKNKYRAYRWYIMIDIYIYMDYVYWGMMER